MRTIIRRAGGWLWSISLIAVLCLTACGPGQNGGEAIGYLRGGTLYRLDPNGGNAFAIAGKTVIGFAWSPDHHQLVARFAAAKPSPAVDPLSDRSPDFPAALGIVSLDGGNVIPITPASSIPLRSDPWWNATGNRLIYREDYPINGGTETFWLQSQNDQPNGIARKGIAQGDALPTSTPDGTTIITTAGGGLMAGAPQATPKLIKEGLAANLPNGLPARILWRPLHQEVLYATVGATGDTTLMVTNLSGQARTIATVANLQNYSWSPDGARLLWRSTNGYTIHSLDGGTDFSWDDSSASLPWWSPDRQHVLIRSTTALTLVNLATRTTRQLMSWPGTSVLIAPPAAGTRFLPLTGSPWSSDGKRIVIAAAGGTWLTGTKSVALPTKSGTGTGLYVFDPNATTTPNLIDWGEHTGVSWSTPDPNAQFLSS